MTSNYCWQAQDSRHTAKEPTNGHRQDAEDHVPCWNIKTAKKQDEEPTKKSDSEGTQKELKIAKKQDEEPVKKFNCEGTQKERHTIVCAIPVRMMHTRLRRKQPVSHAWVLAGDRKSVV